MGQLHPFLFILQSPRGTPQTQGIMSAICGIVLAATSLIVFRLPLALSLVIEILACAGLVAAGVILPAITR